MPRSLAEVSTEEHARRKRASRIVGYIMLGTFATGLLISVVTKDPLVIIICGFTMFGILAGGLVFDVESRYKA